jgi:hypothetical protein
MPLAAGQSLVAVSCCYCIGQIRSAQSEATVHLHVQPAQLTGYVIENEIKVQLSTGTFSAAADYAQVHARDQSLDRADSPEMMMG